MWAPQLAAEAESPGFLSEIENYSGVFCGFHVNDAGGTIFSDPFSLGSIYHSVADGYEVYSSRAAVAAHLVSGPGRSPRRDPRGSGWLAFAHVVVDDITTFAGVEALPESTRVRLDANGASTWSEIVHPADRIQGTLEPSDAVDLIWEDLTAEVRALAEMDGFPLVVGLTGGKDSRLILAIALASGVAKDMSWFTSGPPDLGDVQVADRLRATFGLETPRKREWEPDPLGWDRHGSDLWETYRRFTSMTSGMQTLWSSRRAKAPLQRVTVTGQGGEALSTNYPGSSKFTDPSQLHSFFRSGQKFGQASLIRPSVREYYELATDEMIDSIWSRSNDVRDAVDRSYMRIRSRKWFGIDMEVDRASRIAPLFGAPSIAAAFSLGPELRQAQYVHFEIMRRVDTRLLEIPFVEDTWSDRLQPNLEAALRGEHLPEAIARERRAEGSPGSRPRRRVGRAIEISRIMKMKASAPKENANLRSRAKRRDDHHRILRDVLVDSPESRVFEVVDRRIAQLLVTRYDSLTHQFKQMLVGALTAAVWLDELDLPVNGGGPSSDLESPH